MSVLHQYRWQNLDHCQQRLGLITAGDSLLIYGTANQQETERFLTWVKKQPTPVYWLNHEAGEKNDMGIQSINYQQWLTLIEQHDKTHTWK